ncbi:DUF742 domain-containing protein [Streptomyces sp. CBMA29]|uniref:DUF742 domain-containing protein n=1 Tax=Streptomyces sp. CBMA29 TaxID=1896314 RepID=UPI001661C85A|nr:DUF742 domain-containing protein [Streptomyces sp. CBMA29]MBD0738327.1 hypothetical protein [Streptomyces sp. CBMA29]
MSGSAEDDALFVRPFIMTGGRAEPVQDGLRLETLVAAAPGAGSAPLEFERRRIVALCAEPATVAEVAAGIGVPLGVAKVLIADLVVGGLLLCQQPSELSLHVLERIRDHVRAL